MQNVYFCFDIFFKFYNIGKYRNPARFLVLSKPIVVSSLEYIQNFAFRTSSGILKKISANS